MLPCAQQQTRAFHIGLRDERCFAHWLAVRARDHLADHRALGHRRLQARLELHRGLHLQAAPPANAIWAASGGAAFTVAAAFLWGAGLVAWCRAAKDAEFGTRAPAAMTKRKGRMEKVLICMALTGRTPNVADRKSPRPMPAQTPLATGSVAARAVQSALTRPERITGFQRASSRTMC